MCRLGEGLRNANRLQALTLLGHVVKRQPTWLIKITNHYLLKELIKLLKVYIHYLSDNKKFLYI